MHIKKTQAEITNGNARKENSDNGLVQAYDISMKFTVPRETISLLFPADGFLDQFFNGDDTRLECVCPVIYNREVEDLDVTLHIGKKKLRFQTARIDEGMKVTPVIGGYCQVKCKLQVYPTPEQSGLLDAAIKEFVELEICEMTAHIEDAA